MAIFAAPCKFVMYGLAFARELVARFELLNDRAPDNCDRESVFLIRAIFAIEWVCLNIGWFILQSRE